MNGGAIGAFHISLPFPQRQLYWRNRAPGKARDRPLRNRPAVVSSAMATLIPKIRILVGAVVARW